MPEPKYHSCCYPKNFLLLRGKVFIEYPYPLLYNDCYHDKEVVSMKISLRMMLLFALLLAAICYTVYNWVMGAIDANAAIMYILVLCFPIIRWLSAFVKHLKADPE